MGDSTKRSSFSGKVGFVLAAAGSAVGLGNILRFPYLAAKYGGGIFLLCYLILAVTLGFALMVAEIAIGRKTRQSAIHAYGALDGRFRFLGPLASLVPIIIAPYYCVIGGWVMKYLFVYATGGGAALAAMGQLFYSISLAMGIMITYGSYMKKDSHLAASVHQIEIFDTGIAFLAGLMVIPAVFSFTGGADINAGPGLMFMTLPKVFGNIPITNLIGIRRRTSCLVTAVLLIGLGTLSALGYGVLAQMQIISMAFLDFFDFISNSVMMPVVAFLTCILVGYVIKPDTLIEEAEAEGAPFGGKRLFVFVIKYLAPVCIVAILISSVLSAFGVISI